jgi:hypothetical protein
MKSTLLLAAVLAAILFTTSAVRGLDSADTNRSKGNLPAPGDLVATNKTTKPGLRAEYFRTEEGLEDFPVLAADKKPDLTRVDATINFSSTQEDWPGTMYKDFFYVRWTGKIRIPADGKYTFSLISDDGSRLFIDGKQIIDNGGAHAMEEISRDAQLTAGDHVIKIEFFEKDIDAGCVFLWQSDKIARQVVPATALYH